MSPKDKKTLAMGVFFAAYGIFWMIAASKIPRIGTTDVIGMSFLPFWSGAVLTFLSVILVGVALSKRRRASAKLSQEQEDDATNPPVGIGGYLRVCGTMAAMLVYVILLPTLHFFINTAWVSAAGLALGGEPLKPLLVVKALLISAILFGIFIFWLQIPLPGSIFA